MKRPDGPLISDSRATPLHAGLVVTLLVTGCATPPHPGLDGGEVPTWRRDLGFNRDTGQRGAQTADAGPGAEVADGAWDVLARDARASPDGSPTGATSMTEWVAHAFTPAGLTTGASVAVDAKSGTVHVTGEFAGNHPASFGTQGNHAITSHGSNDVLVTKLKADGSFLWAVAAGGPESDRASAVAVDPAGNTVIAGYYRGAASFGSVTLVAKGARDGFVAKLDPRGKFLWARSVGGEGGDVARAVAVDGQGNVYAGGFFSKQAAAGATTLTSAGGLDGWVARLDPKGKFTWVRHFGGPQDDDCVALAVRPTGTLFVAGRFQDALTNVAGAKASALSSAGGTDSFVVKLTAGGTLLWMSTLGGPGHDRVTGIALAPAGASVISGTFDKTLQLGKDIVTTAGSVDPFLARLDPQGAPVWSLAGGGRRPRHRQWSRRRLRRQHASAADLRRPPCPVWRPRPIGRRDGQPRRPADRPRRQRAVHAPGGRDADVGHGARDHAWWRQLYHRDVQRFDGGLRRAGIYSQVGRRRGSLRLENASPSRSVAVDRFRRGVIEARRPVSAATLEARRL